MREAIEFSDKVIAAQQKLLLALTEDELQEVSEEYKTSVTELAVNSCEKSINRNHLETHDEQDEESIIEPNLIADEIIIEEQDKHEDLLEYDIIIDDETIIHKAELDVGTLETIENFDDEDQCVITNETNENISAGDYIVPVQEWKDECIVLTRDSNDEIVEPQTTVKNKRGRKRLGNLIFICDECGIHISGRMAFDLHCRRHRGDKQFECS